MKGIVEKILGHIIWLLEEMEETQKADSITKHQLFEK
jgi:hypothetical protein